MAVVVGFWACSSMPLGACTDVEMTGDVSTGDLTDNTDGGGDAPADDLGEMGTDTAVSNTPPPPVVRPSPN